MKAYKSVIGQLGRLIFCCLMLMISMLQAQIVIDSTDMPFPGDIINISTGLNIDFIDYTETGEDFTWDFLDLMSLNQTVDTFVSPSQTPFAYQFFFLGRTNLAYQYVQDLPIPDFEFSDVFYFYKNSQLRYDNVGYAASLNGFPLPFVFTTPDVLYKFPLEYGDQDSSVSGVVYNLPDVAYLLLDRKRINKVDGWGTLKTPFGTFEVLRMTSEVTEYDSIYIDSLEMGVPVNRNYIEYKWLAKGQKIPVLKITSDLNGLLVTYTDSIRINYDHINENLIKNKSIVVYPNPADNHVFVEFNMAKPGSLDLSLCDLSGKSWYQETATGLRSGFFRKKISFQDASLNSGTYLLIIKSSKEVYTRKIVINN